MEDSKEEPTWRISIDPKKVNSAVLKRLIAEVEYERQNNINAYNRVHNRHNRSKSAQTITS